MLPVHVGGVLNSLSGYVVKFIMKRNMKQQFYLLVIVAIIPCIMGRNYTWAINGGGSWHTASNWIPEGIPQDGDLVHFDQTLFDTGVTTSPELVDMGGASVVLSTFIMDLSSVKLANGQVTATDNFVFGLGGFSNAKVIVGNNVKGIIAYDYSTNVDQPIYQHCDGCYFENNGYLEINRCCWSLTNNATVLNKEGAVLNSTIENIFDGDQTSNLINYGLFTMQGDNQNGLFQTMTLGQFINYGNVSFYRPSDSSTLVVQATWQMGTFLHKDGWLIFEVWNNDIDNININVEPTAFEFSGNLEIIFNTGGQDATYVNQTQGASFPFFYSGKKQFAAFPQSGHFKKVNALNLPSEYTLGPWYMQVIDSTGWIYTGVEVCLSTDTACINQGANENSPGYSTPGQSPLRAPGMVDTPATMPSTPGSKVSFAPCGQIALNALLLILVACSL